MEGLPSGPDRRLAIRIALRGEYYLGGGIPVRGDKIREELCCLVAVFSRSGNGKKLLKK